MCSCVGKRSRTTSSFEGIAEQWTYNRVCVFYSVCEVSRQSRSVTKAKSWFLRKLIGFSPTLFRIAAGSESTRSLGRTTLPHDLNDVRSPTPSFLFSPSLLLLLFFFFWASPSLSISVFISISINHFRSGSPCLFVENPSLHLCLSSSLLIASVIVLLPPLLLLRLPLLRLLLLFFILFYFIFRKQKEKEEKPIEQRGLLL